jgi:hypothetical protein
MANCRANEERVHLLRQRVRSGGNRLASIGCGSCIELWDQTFTGRDILLIDQDAGALEQAKIKVPPTIGRLTFVQQNILKFILRTRNDQTIGGRDFVYAFGLFDYFDIASAMRLANGLWSLVAPGGCLLVTNAHPSNPTRFWMEYCGDWFLQYKTEAEILSLSASLPGVARQQLTKDSQGVYQYFEIWKESKI